MKIKSLMLEDSRRLIAITDNKVIVRLDFDESHVTFNISSEMMQPFEHKFVIPKGGDGVLHK